MNAAWFIVLLVLPFPILFLLLFFGLKDYKAANKRNYSMLTMFPFELWSNGTRSSRANRFLVYSYALAEAMVGAFFLITIQYHYSLLPMGIVLLVIEVIRLCALVGVCLIPAYSFKPHLLSFTLLASLSVLSCAVSVVSFLNLRAFNETLPIVFAVLLGILGGAEIALLFNPRLTRWTDLKSTMEKDGSVTVERPRPFPLAFTEWLFLGLSFLASVIGLIGFALINGF